MGSFGLFGDDTTDDECSASNNNDNNNNNNNSNNNVTTSRHQQQPFSNTRKRSYPVAFQVEEPAEIYPSNHAIPVAMDNADVVLPFARTMASIIDCLATVFTWMVSLPLKVFDTGISPCEEN